MGDPTKLGTTKLEPCVDGREHAVVEPKVPEAILHSRKGDPESRDAQDLPTSAAGKAKLKPLRGDTHTGYDAASGTPRRRVGAGERLGVGYPADPKLDVSYCDAGRRDSNTPNGHREALGYTPEEEKVMEEP